MEIIPDVEIERGRTKYLFSDGIGKISAEFAKKVDLKCGCKGFFPSAFQIRYGGYKGVVAVDSTSSKKISLRKSMCKYESENTKLDVLAYSKYQPCFLNRQLITLLSTLDPLRALEALDLMSSGEITNILKEMLYDRPIQIQGSYIYHLWIACLDVDCFGVLEGVNLLFSIYVMLREGYAFP
ncbi:hypothetical protein GH714_007313 [Hevea brasiliensis]|uniref:RNA-dependent RNA polymerase n=1 Tax=Hevea brasiliensis TaxID=3981 RepID=A0A6A6LZI5_HEVBR|nr:hypothetical protein GH714_007313 [Hevea brasiliensis]